MVFYGECNTAAHYNVPMETLVFDPSLNDSLFQYGHSTPYHHLATMALTNPNSVYAMQFLPNSSHMLLYVCTFVGVSGP